MTNGEAVQCEACGGLMRAQIDKLGLSWAGDGPYERHDEFGRVRDDEFAGILADVYHCGTCSRVAVRPVRLQLTRSRVHAA
jgi:hypothetical protein